MGIGALPASGLGMSTSLDPSKAPLRPMNALSRPNTGGTPYFPTWKAYAVCETSSMGPYTGWLYAWAIPVHAATAIATTATSKPRRSSSEDARHRAPAPCRGSIRTARD